jgi:hypothetical protein
MIHACIRPASGVKVSKNMTDFSHSLGAAGNRHRAFSFDGTMKFEHHPCSQAQSPVAVPELWR